MHRTCARTSGCRLRMGAIIHPSFRFGSARRPTLRYSMSTKTSCSRASISGRHCVEASEKLTHSRWIFPKKTLPSFISSSRSCISKPSCPSKLSLRCCDQRQEGVRREMMGSVGLRSSRAHLIRKKALLVRTVPLEAVVWRSDDNAGKRGSGNTHSRSTPKHIAQAVDVPGASPQQDRHAGTVVSVVRALCPLI